MQSPRKKHAIFVVLCTSMLAFGVAIFNARHYVQHNPLARADAPINWTVVVVAGQSNAEGTNSLITSIPSGQELGSHPADDQSYIWWEGADGAAPDDATEFFNVISNPGYTASGWIKSVNPNPSLEGMIKISDLDEPIPVGQRNGFFGPEIGIVRELYDQGKRNILVLKVSYGFQALAKANSQFIPYDWYPDIPGEAPRNKSYTHLINAYTDMSDFLTSRGDTYKMAGVFWLQGETDALDSGYAAAYEDNLDLLVNRMWEDLDLDQAAHIVLRKYNLRNCIDNAYPATGSYCGAGYALGLEGASYSTILNALTINAIQSIPLNASRIRTVRQALQTVADRYSWVDIVETDDQLMGPDFMHLTATSQLEVGKRMTQMYEIP